MQTCQRVKDILNEVIFSNDKLELMKRIAESPERFVSLFRPTKPYAKIIQFLLQSHEIKFGNALEHILAHFLHIAGYHAELSRKYRESQGEELSIDILVKKEDSLYLIELKVRDDHDSSKKRGQIENFERKVEAVLREEGENYTQMFCLMCFIDDGLKKNKDYYEGKLKDIAFTYQVETRLLYGKEIFDFFGISWAWDELIECLKEWKRELPDFPVIDYDENPADSTEKLKILPVAVWRKIVDKESLWEKEGIMQVLFRKGETLRLLIEEFRSMEGKRLSRVYKQLANILELRYRKLFQEA